MNKIIKVLVLILCLGTVLYLVVPKRNEECYNQYLFESLSFNGVVIKKFYDKFQHSTPILQIRDLNDSNVKNIDFLGEYSNVYTLIDENDTILKAVESSLITIKKFDGKKIIKNVCFGCDKN